MKKIMFNDKYSLTEAVLNGQKTQTRRICSIPQPPYQNFGIGFPVFTKDEPEKNPLYSSFCWFNKDNEEQRTEWVRTSYRENEIVAVAQCYQDVRNNSAEDVADVLEQYKGTPSWTNKMLVSAHLMPHHIKITNVRLQRLQNISDKDCIAEGVIEDFPGSYSSRVLIKHKSTFGTLSVMHSCSTPRQAYAALIDAISGKGTWDSNPYVFVYEFKLLKGE